MNYSYNIAAESTASSPCSNVLIHCPVCPKTDPTIWKYFMRVHFEEKHKTLDLTKYEQLWKLTNFELFEMKKIWAKQGKVTIKCTKKSKIPLLVVSCPSILKKGFDRGTLIDGKFDDHSPSLEHLVQFVRVTPHGHIL
jgi:hypothetical protein